MKRLFAVFVVFASFLSAQSVIAAITAPHNASGLAWDGSYLWCGAYGVNGDTIYKLEPSNGAILKKIIWHVDDNNETKISQSIYFIRFARDDYSRTEKVIFIR